MECTTPQKQSMTTGSTVWRTAIALVLGGVMSGCFSIQDPPADLASGQLTPPTRFVADTASHGGMVRDNWIADFDDEQLTALVEEAIALNPDLEAAAARVAAAAARIRSAESALRPQLEGLANARRFDDGRSFPADDSIRLDLQVGWELDLWGRLRSNAAAAEAQALATALEFEFAGYSLAARVADAWFLAIASKLQLAIGEDLLAAEELTAEITRDRTAAGISSQLDLELALANVELARSAVVQSRSALAESVRALEILLGRYPAAELAVADDLPPLPAPVPVGLPSELLERRPDVRAADRRVAAAFHQVESARAARLPQLTLTAGLGAFLDPTDEIWSIGAGLLQPLYTGGAIASEIQISEAQQREALANYVAVAIDAFREVESALATEAYLTQRLRLLEVAVRRLSSASDVAQARYDAGILTIFELIQTRRQYFDSRSALLQVELEQLRQRLNLYLALGGSFAGSEGDQTDSDSGVDQTSAVLQEINDGGE